MLLHMNDFFGQRGPLQNFVQRRHFGRVDIYRRHPGHGAQLELTAAFQNDGRAFVRNHRLRSVYDRLQHALEIERGGNFVTDGVQSLENFHLAFGHQQAGVVQSGRCGVIQAIQRKQVVFVKRTSIEFVERLHHADERALV
jgi:hypothetical protein